MSIHTGDKVYSFKCHVLCLFMQGIKFILYSNTIYSQGWVKLSRITHLGSKWNSVQKYVVLQWTWSLHNQKVRRWEQRAEDESSRAEWQELRGMHESGGWGICKWQWEFRRMQILPLEPVESAAPQTKDRSPLHRRRSLHLTVLRGIREGRFCWQAEMTVSLTCPFFPILRAAVLFLTPVFSPPGYYRNRQCGFFTSLLPSVIHSDHSSESVSP